jgi:hypothetical protein
VTIRFDQGFEAQKFFLGLTSDPKHSDGFVEICLERNREEDLGEENCLRGMWKAGDRDLILKMLKEEVEV